MSRADEAIILAGGFGTRLRDVVGNVPKPLAPIRGRPFICWLLDAMADQGMRQVVLATGYMGDLVASTLGPNWRGLALRYSKEEQPLGTGGAMALAASQLSGETFFVVNGDTWISIDYADFDLHMSQAAIPIGMALAEVPDTSRYGAVKLDAHGKVAGFVEKGVSGGGFVNAGVYRLDRAACGYFPDRPDFSFETEVLLPATASGAVAGYTRTREFIDIGVPADYQRAQEQLPSRGNQA